MCMPKDSYLIDALNTVLDWQLPDHLLGTAVDQETRLMAGFDCESDYDHEVWLSPESFVPHPQ